MEEFCRGQCLFFLSQSESLVKFMPLPVVTRIPLETCFQDSGADKTLWIRPVRKKASDPITAILHHGPPTARTVQNVSPPQNS